MVTIRPARLCDAYKVGPELRDEDKRELEAYMGLSPCKALSRCIMWSAPDKSFVAEDSDGNAFMIFGVVPSGDGSGQPWLVATDRVEAHKLAFARHSKYWLSILSEGYSRLHNYAHAGNTLHLKWLRWLGFTFATEPTWHRNEPFLYFHKGSTCAV